MEQSIDNTKMQKYLLGELPEEVRERLEEAYFADDGLYERLLAVEDELIHAYARGELSQPDRERFESRFLTSGVQRQKVEFVKALLRSSSFQPAIKTSSTRTERSLWQNLLAALRRQSLAMRLSLAAGLILIVFGSTWLIMENLRLRSQLRQLQAEQETLRQQEQRLQQQATDQRERNDLLVEELQREREQRDLLEQERAALRTEPSIVSFLLTPYLTRGDNDPNKLTIPQGAGLLRLLMNVERDSGYKSYRAVLRTVEGVEIRKQDILPIGSAQDGKTAVLSLPSKSLASGDYILTLSGVNRKGDIEEISYYYFRVKRE
jgi:hypothetical protein